MEQLKHECGVAMVRLMKPLDHYHRKYGIWMYGLNKLYLMMEKQHNRGQEGAGLACLKMNAAPGQEFLYRERAEGNDAIRKVFAAVHETFRDLIPVNLTMLISRAATFPSPEKSIWDIFVTPPRERAAFLMSIRFCDAATGGRRTCASAPIST